MVRYIGWYTDMAITEQEMTFHNSLMTNVEFGEIPVGLAVLHWW